MAILVVLIILLILLTFLGAFGGSIRYKESYYNEVSSEYPIVHPSQIPHVQSFESHQGVEIPSKFQHPAGMVNHQSMETYNEEPEEYQEHDQEVPVEPFEGDGFGAPY